MLKRIIISALLALTCLSAFAQTTERPYVESQYQSQYSTANIAGVIADESKTLVLIEYITARGYSNQTVGFSSKTKLYYANKALDIIGWGYWDGEDIQEKNMDEYYAVDSDRRYPFVLVFPAIPAGTRKISIRENVENEFYWIGIHLDVEEQYSGNVESSGSGYISGQGSSSYNPSFNPTSSGTCFAINENGYLATCYHVIEGASRIRIRGVNGDFSSLLEAKVISTDKRNDLALLKITDKSFKSISGIPYVISKKTADVGEDVYVLGYPLRAVMGDEIKLTNGLVSAKTGYQGDATSYQISATVQPGNSGGPLFDGNGNVIGVVNARLGVESAAYAVKSPYLTMLVGSVDSSISLPIQNRLMGKSLKDKVKEINKFVYIIEVE